MLCEVKMAKSPWKIFCAKVNPLLISMKEWNINDDDSVNLSKGCHKHHTLHVWNTALLGVRTFRAFPKQVGFLMHQIFFSMAILPFWPHKQRWNSQLTSRFHPDHWPYNKFSYWIMQYRTFYEALMHKYVVLSCIIWCETPCMITNKRLVHQLIGVEGKKRPGNFFLR